MNFAELRDETIIWTKRPDLISATNSAIRRNTLKYHRVQKWMRDLVVVEGILNPTPNEPVAIIPIATFFPRFRQFARVSVAGFRDSLKPMEVNDELDLDGYARTGIYLVAGVNLNIKWHAGFHAFDVAYYQDPVVTETGFASWIADDYPDLIATASAAEILSFDNEAEIYRAAKTTEMEQFRLLQMNNLESEAR